MNFPDHGVSAEVPPLQPLTVDLPAHEPGIYSFYCQPNAIQGKLIVAGLNGVHPTFLDDPPALAIEDEPAHAAPQASSRSSRVLAGVLRGLLEAPGFKLTRPVIDFLLLVAAVLIAQSGLSGLPAYTPLFALPPLTIVLFLASGVYRERIRVLAFDGIVPVLSGVTTATMAVMTVGVLMNQRVPSESVVFAWMCALAGLDAGRLALANTQRWARRRSLIGKPVLIAGLGRVGTQLARRLENHPEYGLRPIGFLDDNPSPEAQNGRPDLPVLGPLADIDEIIARTHVDHLIVAFSLTTDAHMSRLVEHCQELGVEVSVVPRMFETMNQRTLYEAVGGLPLLSFSMIDPKGWQFAVKYALDRLAAAMMLTILTPLLALLAVMVKLSTGGPVLFRQPRVGLDGRQFDMLKFRTMKEAPEHPGADENPEEPDPLERMLQVDTAPGGVEGVDRRTRLGRLLRRLSLDELPQFWNVLRGEMSLIGPRPERVDYVRCFEPVVYRYAERHRVKSGITGLAQVHGLRGQTSLAERIEWDNYYISHWSLGQDLKILLLTLIAAFHNSE